MDREHASALPVEIDWLQMRNGSWFRRARFDSEDDEFAVEPAKKSSKLKIRRRRKRLPTKDRLPTEGRACGAPLSIRQPRSVVLVCR
jgi:hypothetical protein